MKLATLLFLVCLQLAAQPSYKIFHSGNFKGIKNQQGEVLIPAVYGDLGWSNGVTPIGDEWIGFNENSKWGLMSLANKKRTQARFDKIEPFTSGRFLVAMKGKFANRFFYGLIDSRGKIILNLDYFELTQEHGTILVTTYENNRFLMGTLNNDLSKVIEVNYLEIEVFGNLLICKTPSKEIDVYTKSGQLLEQNLHQTRKIKDFLLTSKNGRNGLISIEGKIIHPPIHKKILSFKRISSFPVWEIRSKSMVFEIAGDSIDYMGQDFWIIHSNGSSQFFSNSVDVPKGGFALKQLLNGVAVVQSVTTGKWFAYDSIGSQIIQASDSIHFNGTYFYAKNDSHWTISDRSGEHISVKKFATISPQTTRYQPVKRFNYWAILDCIDQTLTNFRYDSITQVVGSKIIVQYIGRWGVYHLGQGWLVQPSFDRIDFSNGQFIAKKGRTHHLLNANGQLLFRTINWVAPQENHFILTYGGKFSGLNLDSPVTNTVFRSVTKWNNFYELNSEFVDLVTSEGGKILHQSDQVQDILAFSEGFFLVKKNNNFGFIDTNGHLRIANRYDSAKAFSEGLAAMKLRGKWGFIDKFEKIIIQPHYQWVTSFVRGLAIYKSTDYYGLLDSNGREVLAANYISISRTSAGNYLMQSKNNTYEMANSKGITFLSGTYEQLVDIGNSRVIGTLSGKKGVLNYQNQLIANFEYEEIKIGEEYLILKKGN